MKTIITSAFFFLSIMAFGQEGYQIADTTKSWSTIQYGWGNWGVMECDGTTSIRLTDAPSPGSQYLQVMETQDSLLQTWNVAGYIREDTIAKQVFFKTGGQEGLIYDFSLEVGDTVQIENRYLNHNFGPVVCDYIDHVNINGLLKKRFFLTHILRPERNRGFLDEIWIEGVGSNYGIMHSGYGALVAPGGDISMLCCNQNGNTIYMDSLFNKCYYDTFYPQIIQNSYDTAYLGIYYGFQVLVDAGDAVSFELIGDVIPEGFSFDASTGVLFGTPSQTGAFTCIITAKNHELNALTDMIYEDLIVVLPTATAGPDRPQDLKIYPNPFNTTLNVVMQQAVNKLLQMEIYSPNGKLLRKISFTNASNFDLSNFRNGLYLVRITDSEGKVLLKESVLKQ